jgi:hypothetical protein
MPADGVALINSFKHPICVSNNGLSRHQYAMRHDLVENPSPYQTTESSVRVIKSIPVSVIILCSQFESPGHVPLYQPESERAPLFWVGTAASFLTI